jgi:small basic protein (TIGR04137 family)
MSIDRSLKVKGALSRHRNVLSRGERLQILKDEDTLARGNSVMGLPKGCPPKSWKQVVTSPVAYAQYTCILLRRNLRGQRIYSKN